MVIILISFGALHFVNKMACTAPYNSTGNWIGCCNISKSLFTLTKTQILEIIKSCGFYGMCDWRWLLENEGQTKRLISLPIIPCAFPEIFSSWLFFLIVTDFENNFIPHVVTYFLMLHVARTLILIDFFHNKRIMLIQVVSQIHAFYWVGLSFAVLQRKH